MTEPSPTEPATTPPAKPPLTRTVVALGVVSFFTDIAADMVTPYIPIFLRERLRAPDLWIGLIEGVAESTSALVKYLSGRWSDRITHKKPLVMLGYGIANLARPFMALAGAPWHILGVRFVDRIGKGIRTAPRDALIARDTAPEHRARAFGFHRGMDNLGAVFGPLVATALLWVFPDDLRVVFAATVVPGLAAVLVLAFGVRERDVSGAPATSSKAAPPGAVPGAPMSLELKRYLGLVAVFTLANASDSFLLLRAHELGVPTRWTPIAWGGLSLLRALATTPGGRFADRFGRERALALGWLLYAVAYAMFGAARSPALALAGLVVYGAYYGLTEGTERALVASFAREGELGRAYGAFNLVTGALALPASLWFGAALPLGHGAVSFGVAAALALVAAAGMMATAPRAQAPRTS